MQGVRSKMTQNIILARNWSGTLKERRLSLKTDSFLASATYHRPLPVLSSSFQHMALRILRNDQAVDYLHVLDPPSHSVVNHSELC
ncbi:hypothetical protein TNIN_310541 [Trichonephila inaurata madagascariensis]|uniref:Uncharacterized protein n=1 Tax=Trichonephila inaurata madagascariensis TaxID=2747483 RepID=A0A8X6YQT3_9ARAC|nr:hypothetical protein TNIN_310541 [Trichonephila inaurata madagascariensis]